MWRRRHFVSRGVALPIGYASATILPGFDQMKERERFPATSPLLIGYASVAVLPWLVRVCRQPAHAQMSSVRS